MTEAPEPRFQLNPYLDWAKAEGVPIVEDFGVNLHRIGTAPWPRLAAKGAIVHLKGCGDQVSIFLIDLPPGGKTSPQKHLYEEVVFVLEGHGSTEVEAADGRKHVFEWGPNSLFALPLNLRHTHFNGSGQERALFASTTNLRLLFNLFRNEEFIFANPARFPERAGKESYFSGEGDFIPRAGTRPVWETNFVPDVARFELRAWTERGGGGSNMMFMLADGTMHAHTSEMPVGTYKKAHRHGPDFHVFCVNGTGYSLLWYEKDADFTRVDWHHGVVYSPPDMMFHQHFNTGTIPARYLATAHGSLRYPLTAERVGLSKGGAVSVKLGGRQIEYEDQDPRIHQLYLDELRRHGGTSKMAPFIDESKYRT